MQWSRNLVQDSNFPDHTISKFPDVFRTKLHFDEKPKKNGYRTARSKGNLEKSLLFHLPGPVLLRKSISLYMKVEFSTGEIWKRCDQVGRNPELNSVKIAIRSLSSPGTCPVSNSSKTNNGNSTYRLVSPCFAVHLEVVVGVVVGVVVRVAVRRQ